jgi:translation initiation factor IF-1
MDSKETKNQDSNVAEGIVIEALPEATFKVLIGDDQEVLAYLAGKMRVNRIKVLVGDKVEMKMDPYGGKARIFKRL